MDSEVPRNYGFGKVLKIKSLIGFTVFVMGLGMQREERRLWDQLTGLVGYIWGDEKITFQRLGHF